MCGRHAREDWNIKYIARMDTNVQGPKRRYGKITYWYGFPEKHSVTSNRSPCQKHMTLSYFTKRPNKILQSLVSERNWQELPSVLWIYQGLRPFWPAGLCCSSLRLLGYFSASLWIKAPSPRKLNEHMALLTVGTDIYTVWISGLIQLMSCLNRLQSCVFLHIWGFQSSSWIV